MEGFPKDETEEKKESWNRMPDAHLDTAIYYYSLFSLGLHAGSTG